MEWKRSKNGDKNKVDKALVFPVAMDGAETWTTRKADIEKIEAFELAKMLRISRIEKRTNASIKQQVKITTLLRITTSLMNRIRRN